MKIFFLVMALVSNLAQADCNFLKMSASKKVDDGSIFRINSTKSILLLGSGPNQHAHEGPAWLMEKDKKKCKINGGIFSDLYINLKKNTLLTQEYSGSDSYAQIIDLRNCKPIGKRANFNGAAEIEANKLISSPVCEPTEKDISECSSGMVFLYTGSSCRLVLDEKASKILTKKELGVELPSLDKSYKVKNPKSAKAQLMIGH